MSQNPVKTDIVIIFLPCPFLTGVRSFIIWELLAFLINIITRAPCNLKYTFCSKLRNCFNSLSKQI